MVQNKIPNKDYLVLTEQPLAGTTFSNLLKVLAENKFRINIPFLPRILYVLLMSMAMSPLRAYENYKTCKNLDNVQPANPVFIIGHWRSGTTFLHYLMGQDTALSYVSTLETMAPHLFIVFENLIKKIIEKELPNKRPMDDLEMDTQLPYEEEYAVANLCPYSFYHGWYFPNNLYNYFKKYVLFNNVSQSIVEDWKKNYAFLLKKITYKYDSHRILLKSLVNTARIKFLLELFPDAQFIHIYRHPLKVYLSTWKLYRKILPIFSFQHVEKDQLDNSIIKIYRDLYTHYFEQKNLIPEKNLIELPYETFVKNPINSLQKIYLHLGLDNFEKAKPRFLQYTKKHQDYRPDVYSLNEPIKEKIYKEWQFAFKKFGYTINDIV